MVRKQKSSNTSPTPPLRIWLLACASSVALTALVISLSTRIVQADAHLSQPVATATFADPVQSATPALLAPRKPEGKHPSATSHGVASWYGEVFNGRRTASGERFDMKAMTACHPTLPFGSVVRVINRKNHRSVVVRITDRGYLYGGRIIDLSYGAAQQLAMTDAGIAKVDLQVISLGRPHRAQ
jgi:rare lipoprotein A